MEVEVCATSTDPLLLCLMCKRLLQEAVQLKCLHNCCRKCFDAAASTVGSEGVSCASCGAITEAGSEQLNGFIDGQVQRYIAIAASRVCGMCKGSDKPALLWCSTCRHSLCGDCVSGHRQYFMQHDTKSLEELSSMDEVSMNLSGSTCAVHQKPQEVACRDCERVKCVTCSAECVDKMHEIYSAGNESFDMYVDKFISSIAAMESGLLRKSEVLDKPKILMQDTKVARDRHLKEIGMRKRRVVATVNRLYREIETTTKNAYSELEAERSAAAAVADRIKADLSDTRSYIRRLVESDNKSAIINQHKMVHERLTYLLTELDSLSKRLSTTIREVKIESSLPDNMKDCVRAWIGIPRTYGAQPPSSSAPAQPPSSSAPSLQLSMHQLPRLQQQHQASSSPPAEQQPQQQSFSFADASASFELPDRCVDVVLTQDGRSLLLAAVEHGLIELCSASGRELSRWPPLVHISGLRDNVRAVSALSDGRAAVGLYYSRLVLLLRRNDRSNGSSSSSATGGAAAAVAPAASNQAWTVDRFIQLPWYADFLSAHGDVLAVSGAHRVQLLNISSWQRLNNELQRGYTIRGLVVAGPVLVTGSLSKVDLGGSRRAACVLDAHCLHTDGCSDKRLWRQGLTCGSSSDQEQKSRLCGLCADSVGRCLYAAVYMSDWTGSYVTALSLADGSQLRRIALSYHDVTSPVGLPMRLSLCEVGAAEQQQRSSRSDGRELLLAVVCRYLDVGTVTLHHSTSDTLQ